MAAEKPDQVLLIGRLICAGHSGGDVAVPCGICAEHAKRLAKEGWAVTPPKDR